MVISGLADQAVGADLGSRFSSLPGLDLDLGAYVPPGGQLCPQCYQFHGGGHSRRGSVSPRSLGIKLASLASEPKLSFARGNRQTLYR